MAMANATFGKLSFELRNEIYGLVKEDLLEERSQLGMAGEARTPAIAQVCRELRYESMGMFFDVVKVNLDSEVDGVDVVELVTFLVEMPVHLISVVGRLEVRVKVCASTWGEYYLGGHGTKGDLELLGKVMKALGFEGEKLHLHVEVCSHDDDFPHLVIVDLEEAGISGTYKILED